MMPTLVLMGYMIGIPLLIKGLLLLKRKRMIEDIPRSRIRSLAMGLVEIHGRVLPPRQMLLGSPLSLSPCVYYEYSVEAYVNGKNSGWSTLKKGTYGIPFYLQDETGTVLVDPTGAEVTFERMFEYRSNMGMDPPPTVRNFLWANNISYKGIIWNREMRYRERFIAPNDFLYILGTASDNPYVPNAFGRSGVDDVMIQKGWPKVPYMISDQPEIRILDRFKRQLEICLLLGGALVCLSVTGTVMFLSLAI